MPTGYTAAVADGKVTDLRTFALTCARGMGGLIMMRDEPFDAPIPERFEPSTSYYDEAIEQAETDLRELALLSPEECAARAKEQHDKDVKAREEYRAEKVEKRARYLAMIAAVERWDCAAEGVKDFMLSQLRESLDFDCGSPGEELKYYPAPITPDPEAWRSERLAKAARDLEYNKAEREKEIARTEERNRWLAQLRASLPAEGATA